MDESLSRDDRAVCATTQMEMEMRSGVMTTRRLGEVVTGWADGDGGAVLVKVWDDLMESAGC